MKSTPKKRRARDRQREKAAPWVSISILPVQLREKVVPDRFRYRFLLRDQTIRVQNEVWRSLKLIARRVREDHNSGLSRETIRRQNRTDSDTIRTLLHAQTKKDLLHGVESPSEAQVIALYKSQTTKGEPPAVRAFARSIMEPESRVRRILTDHQLVGSESGRVRRPAYSQAVIDRAVQLRQDGWTLGKIRHHMRSTCTPSRSTIQRWCSERGVTRGSK